MSASHLVLAQAERKKNAIAAGESRDDPMQNNPFFASAGVQAAVTALVTLVVCNANETPTISMLPNPENFRGRIYRHIDETTELRKLLNRDGANEAPIEEWRTAYVSDEELALLAKHLFVTDL